MNRLETQPAAQVVLLSPHDVRLQEKKKKGEEYLDQKSENRDSRKQGHEAVVRTASMKKNVQGKVRVRVIAKWLPRLFFSPR